MEQILALAKKVAEEAEVFTVTSENTPIQFETNRLKHAQTHQSTMVALRVVRRGRMGYATATRLDDVETLVNMAAETAEFGMKAQFEFPSLSEHPKVEVFDSEVGNVPLDKMVGLGEEMIAALRAHTPELLCDARIGRGTSSVSIMNTRGGQASYQQTHFSLMVSGTLIRGTDMLFVGESESSCHPVLETGAVIGMVKLQLERAREIAPISTASLPVIFTPSGVVSALIEPLMTGFNGKTVLQGASPLGKRLGEAAVDSKISLWDDPTIAYRPTSRPCDEEGVPSQRTPLFEQGSIANFLYDLQTAAQAGRRSTGNAGRGRGLPSPSPSAFIFASGDVSFEQMVSEVKEGLVVEDLMGAGQGNVLGGDFSGNVLLGYKIENGRITGRVKNAMVSGNVYQLLKNVAAVGSDGRWVGGVHTPSLFFPAVSVAAK
ncbi:MAG: peptidase C69 [Chloroflexi bacterium RBG_16_57_8]|nr:MAG: peptidase C69 [Chloroflexi bacterium RBG_16_57_8]